MVSFYLIRFVIPAGHLIQKFIYGALGVAAYCFIEKIDSIYFYTLYRKIYLYTLVICMVQVHEQ